ncbi:UNVERIFIED_CONTAM: hypothetical protein GTU68_009505, partial [Idotea baltica]|nr:hypothetical protein [Idotea baltica]
MNAFVPYSSVRKPPISPRARRQPKVHPRPGGNTTGPRGRGYDTTYTNNLFRNARNWSFGTYFKTQKPSLGLGTRVSNWGTSRQHRASTHRLPLPIGDPSEFDAREAWDLWAVLFEKAGLDPKVHIVNGNVKDNFWMMGETGPCGPCSELHVDMTPNGDTGGKLVNMDSDLCIEIWNLVFIQYNAEADGSFRDLPAKHVDTGMGFERVCSLIQNTKGFTDFSEKPTNYATDVFQPIFRKLEELSGKKYHDIYPGDSSRGSQPMTAEEGQTLEQAIAFRVIADHIRTLSFSIADSIMPGNTGRNYVLRRILRRAVKYGRALGFTGDKPFLPELVDTLVAEFGKVFPELGTRAQVVKETLATEEISFNKTLDRGLKRFSAQKVFGDTFPSWIAFELYDTYGFPIDLTALLCREKGLKLNENEVEEHMEKARELSRGAQKKTIVRALDLSTDAVTEFVGFDSDSCEATILEVHDDLIITNKTVFFTEMGGQEGDTGTIRSRGSQPLTTHTQKIGSAIAHQIEGHSFQTGDKITLTIDRARRAPIEAHHTATHLLHWALHEVVSQDAAQQGSSVSPDRLRFDFNSKAVTPEQITAIEEKVNAAISAGDLVSWIEVPHAEVKDNKDIMQFFGDKYGDLVRVVQIGGGNKTLDGYSMELCGGTHVTNTKDIGFFKIKSEGAIASGVRRIEAVCGQSAWDWLTE